MFNPSRPLAVLPLLLFALLLSSPALAESPASSTLDPFNGEWERVAIEEDDAYRRTAIESAIAGLSWLTRQMAAPILHSTTSPPGRYEFIVSAPELLLGQRGEEPRPLPLDGSVHGGKGPRGDFTAQSHFVDGAIETEWVFTDAHGRNRYTVTDGGDTLLVEHEIEVTGLSGVEPIAYRSRFQRTPAVAAAASAESN